VWRQPCRTASSHSGTYHSDWRWWTWGPRDGLDAHLGMGEMTRLSQASRTESTQPGYAGPTSAALYGGDIRRESGAAVYAVVSRGRSLRWLYPMPLAPCPAPTRHKGRSSGHVCQHKQRSRNLPSRGPPDHQLSRSRKILTHLHSRNTVMTAHAVTNYDCIKQWLITDTAAPFNVRRAAGFAYTSL
jgi:hypothetical protein